MAMSPDGKTLYVPSLEGPHWHVVDAMTGDVLAKVVTEVRRAQHDLWARRQAVYLGGPEVADPDVADPATHKSSRVGPFGARSGRSRSTAGRRSAS